MEITNPDTWHEIGKITTWYGDIFPPMCSRNPSVKAKIVYKQFSNYREGDTQLNQWTVKGNVHNVTNYRLVMEDVHNTTKPQTSKRSTQCNQLQTSKGIGNF